jgi:hypothetical protein
MPYIKEKDRERLIQKSISEDCTTAFLQGEICETSGELNYMITNMILGFLDRKEEQDGKQSYARINDAIGALECAKLELYRRLAAPYEDKKITENGDVY